MKITYDDAVQQMNNRYICKAKRKDNGEWVEGDLMQWDTGTTKICVDEGYCVKLSIPVIPETICQCTTLTDKNGKLIFDGDVLKFVNDDGESSFYVVVWNTSLLSWQVQEMSCYVRDDYYGFDELCEFGNTEVIGNIHDNRDLLEVKNG